MEVDRAGEERFWAAVWCCSAARRRGCKGEESSLHTWRLTYMSIATAPTMSPRAKPQTMPMASHPPPGT